MTQLPEGVQHHRERGVEPSVTFDEARAYSRACYQAGILTAIQAISADSVIDQAAEALWGHTREQAVEWAKEDKLESARHNVRKALEVFVAAIRAAK